MSFKIAILASTQGTDLQAIIDSVSSGELAGVAEIKCVITDRECFAAERAKQQGIETFVLDKGKFASREEFDKEVAQVLDERGVQLVCLAGYMRILSTFFVQKFAGRIINVHPSLLPSFPGGMDKNVHQLVIDSGVKVTGCTFHFVDETVDGGAIIAQQAVVVLDDDTSSALKERVQQAEKKLYPMIIKMFAQGKLKVDGKKVWLLE